MPIRKAYFLPSFFFCLTLSFSQHSIGHGTEAHINRDRETWPTRQTEKNKHDRKASEAGSHLHTTFDVSAVASVSPSVRWRPALACLWVPTVKAPSLSSWRSSLATISNPFLRKHRTPPTGALFPAPNAISTALLAPPPLGALVLRCSLRFTFCSSPFFWLPDKACSRVSEWVSVLGCCWESPQRADRNGGGSSGDDDDEQQQSAKSHWGADVDLHLLSLRLQPRQDCHFRTTLSFSQKRLV